MSFEEEFDSIIKRKAEAENYAFDESNWEKASRVLDAEKNVLRAAKMKKFYFASAFVIITGAAGLLTFNYLKPASDNSGQVAQAVESAVSANQTANTELTKVPSQSKNISEENTQNSSALVEEQNVVESITTNKATTNNLANENSDAVKNNSVDNSIKTGKSDLISNTKTSKEAGTVASKNAGVNRDLEKSQAATPFENIKSESDKNADPINKNESPVDEKNESLSSPAKKEDVFIADNKEEQSIKNPIPVTNDQISLNAAQAKETVLTTDQLSTVYSSLPFEVADFDLMQTPFVYLERYDEDYYKKNQNPKAHYLNIELGGNYLLGWEAKSGKDAKGLNWYAGLNYGRYLSKKLSLSFGFQAYNIANITQPFYLVSSKEYGFGSKNIYTRVTSGQLYYVALPLKLNYHINSSNSFALGLNTAYLASANNTVEKYYVMDNEEKSIGSPADSHNTGVYQGTRMLNMMLSANYRAQFGKRIGINLEFNYGLTDIFENTETIKNKEKTMGIRLGLTYTLFDK